VHGAGMLEATSQKPILLSEPILGEEEKEALCAVIDSGWLTMGDRVAEFEKAFAALHGADAAVAVNSCTAALHLALVALGIGPGDEVLVPSLTFVATANAVLYAGATPVFVDIESLSQPHISLEDAGRKLTSRTSAVIVMHYGGYLVDLEKWRAFADAHRLFLIEDAAHAPGIQPVGLLSEAACFSFFSNKNLSTAEGGMVLARDPNVRERIRRLRAHGMTSDTLVRHRGHAYSYDVKSLGYNYRMDELRAAVGLAQLPRLLEWNARRCELSHEYRSLVSRKIPDVKTTFDLTWATAAHLMAAILPPRANRKKVMDRLRENGIQSSIHYPPIHLFAFYRERFSTPELRKTEEFSSREITLPLHAAMESPDISRVVETLSVAVVDQIVSSQFDY
jgi:dTDP-4-amino-4,6-dideoxygalactose transaminase